VIANYGALSLPEPPRGQYYARVDGSVVLVDGRTELAVRIVRPA
jgi:Ni/Co efflux regulator RcnB